MNGTYGTSQELCTWLHFVVFSTWSLTVTRTTRMPVFWGYPLYPMITHTIDQFMLDPKLILLTSSYWIPSSYYWPVHIGSQAHTIDQFILDPKLILLTSSYWIPSSYYWPVHTGSQAHTIDQFILDPKLILLTSSYWIPSSYYWLVHIGSQAHTIDQFILDPKSKQDKVKATNLNNLPKVQIF